MAKFTREELSSRINELDIDEELKMSLIEDITDSIEDPNSKYQELEEKYNKLSKEKDDLYAKYKERFFTSDSKKVEDVPEIEPEVNANVIDVKEIF